MAPKNTENVESKVEETKVEETKVEETKVEEPKVDDREEIYVPRGYANDEPNLIIAVNGVNYVLPRGKTSKVPKHIAAEFRRSQKAQESLDKRMDELLEASK